MSPPAQITTEQEGEILSVQMKMDEIRTERLCDQIMEAIYSLAENHPTATRLKLTLQVPGKRDAVIQMQDLNSVRKYEDKQTYAVSRHRREIGNPLLAAGMIEPASLYVPGTPGSCLIGNTYETTGNVSRSSVLNFLTKL